MKFVRYIAKALADLVQLLALYVTSSLLLLILLPVGIGTFLIWMSVFFGLAILVIACITKLLDHHAVVRPELLASLILILSAVGIYVLVIGGAAIALASRSILRAKIKAISFPRR